MLRVSKVVLDGLWRFSTWRERGMWKSLISVGIGKIRVGCGKVGKRMLKKVWKMGLCFWKKSVKLKSVDEHPHKQVK